MRRLDSRVSLIEYDEPMHRPVSDTKLGTELWNWLRMEEIIQVMEIYTAYGRPAVEGIAGLLQSKFGEDVQPDNVKQTIGSMVGKIMKHLGYGQDGSEAIVGPVFKNGMVYSR